MKATGIETADAYDERKAYSLGMEEDSDLTKRNSVAQENKLASTKQASFLAFTHFAAIFR